MRTRRLVTLPLVAHLVSVMVLRASVALATDGNPVEAAWRFDSAGRLIGLEDASGWTNYGYDPGGRLLSVKTASGETRLDYDDRGRLSAVRDPAGTTTLQYDSGRSTVQVALSHSPVRRVEYEFGSHGQIRELRLLDSQGKLENRSRYDYDVLGRLVAVRLGDDGQTDRTIRFEHRPGAGQVIRHLPDGTASTFQFDPIGRLESLRHEEPAHGTSASFRLMYDPAGRLNRVTLDSAAKTSSAEYRYDAASRLAEFREDGAPVAFRYGPDGSLQSIADGGSTYPVRYDDFGQPVTVGDWQLSYEPGSVTAKNGKAVLQVSDRPDPHGPLREVSLPGTTSRLRYDNLGNLLTITQNRMLHAVPNYLSAASSPIAFHDDDGRLVSVHPPVGSLGVAFEPANGALRYQLESPMPNVEIRTDRHGRMSLSRPPELPRPLRLMHMSRYREPNARILQSPRPHVTTMSEQIRNLGGNMSRNVEKLIDRGRRMPMGSGLETAQLRILEPEYYRMIDSLDQTMDISNPAEVARTVAGVYALTAVEMLGRPIATATQAVTKNFSASIGAAMMDGVIRRIEDSLGRALGKIDPVATAQFTPIVDMNDRISALVNGVTLAKKLTEVHLENKPLSDSLRAFAVSKGGEAVSDAIAEPLFAIQRGNGAQDVLVGGVGARRKGIEAAARKFLGPDAIGIPVNSGPFGTLGDLVWAMADQVFGGHLTRTDEMLWSKLSLVDQIGTLVVHSHGSVTLGNLHREIDHALEAGEMKIDKVVFAGADMPDKLVAVLQKHGVPFEQRMDSRDPVPIVTTPNAELGERLASILPFINGIHIGRFQLGRHIGGALWKVGAMMELPSFDPATYSTSYHTLEHILEKHSTPPNPFTHTEQRLGGIKIGGHVEFEGDLGRISGAWFDAKSQRLVLVSDRDRTLPGVKPEHLAVAFAALFRDAPVDPAFTLDPWDENNPEGEWLRAVYIPHDLIAGTDVGRILFSADWKMKQMSFSVSVGEDHRVTEWKSKVPEFQTVKDILLKNGASPPRWVRYFFEQDRMVLESSKDAVQFRDVVIRVTPKRQERGPDGKLRDVDVDDPVANEFAHSFTSNYDKLAAEVPVLAELKEVYKAFALAWWLRQESIPVDLEWTKAFLRGGKFIEKVNALDVGWTASGPEKHSRQGNIVKVEREVSKVSLFGGVSLEVRPTYVPETKVLRDFAQSVDGQTSEDPTTPILSVPGGERVVQYTVLPVNQAGRDLWGNQPHPSEINRIYSRDGNGRITAARPSDGYDASYEYDGDGKLHRVETEGDGGWTSIASRNQTGMVLELRSPTADPIDVQFDVNGVPTGVSIAGKAVASITADPKARAIAIRDSDERSVRIELGDQLHDMSVSIKGPVDGPGGAGNELKIRFDDAGRATTLHGLLEVHADHRSDLSALRGPRGSFMVRRNEAGRAVHFSGPDGSTLERTYDDDRLRELVLKRGGQTASVRILGPDLVEVVNFGGGTTRYQSKDGGSKRNVTDSGGGTLQYTLDGRLVREIILPDTGRVTLDYEFDSGTPPGQHGKIRSIRMKRWPRPAQPAAG